MPVSSSELRVPKGKSLPIADVRQAFFKSAIENGIIPFHIADVNNHLYNSCNNKSYADTLSSLAIRKGIIPVSSFEFRVASSEGKIVAHCGCASSIFQVSNRKRYYWSVTR